MLFRSLEQRRKRLPELLGRKRRSIDRDYFRAILSVDNPECYEQRVIDAVASATLALDDSIPNGSYIDMCMHLPVIDPAKIHVPTAVLRGQFDGVAALDDLIEFFKRLPNPDKQFIMLSGMAHASFQQKNFRMVYHILHSFYTRPEPIYTAPGPH